MGCSLPLAIADKVSNHTVMVDIKMISAMTVQNCTSVACGKRKNKPLWDAFVIEVML